MKDFLNKGITKIQEVAGSASDVVAEKWSLVVDIVNDLPVLVSLERSSSKLTVLYDEKHYFVIPYKPSDIGIALHCMRCLPDGVPEINELPKRRVFHFPNQHAEVLVRKILVEQGRDIVIANSKDKKHSIEELANDIDKLDKKLTYGMLLVGGATALVNPLLGLGIAAKAILPGAASIVNKFGLRPMGEKLTQAKLDSELKAAEEKILTEFEDATTLQVINPILEELEFALKTDESTHDPLIDFDMSNLGIPELDSNQWRLLTEKAIFHVYKDCMSDKSKQKQAGLGPEDIRWFQTLFSTFNRTNEKN